MAGKVIDATLKLIDKFTEPMQSAVSTIERSSKKIQRAGKEIKETGEKISGVGKKLTAGVTAPIVAAGIASFELASDLNESLNKVDVAFGKNSNNVKKWSKTTLDNFGLSQNTALETVSLYGDMATGMGLSTKQAANMSKTLTGLSADMASFKNVSQEQAQDALKGIFTGEGESLKSLGVIMTDTTLQAYAVKEGFLKSTVSAKALAEMSVKTEIAQSNLATKIKKYGVNSIEAKKAQLTLNKALENQSAAAKGSYSDLTQAQKIQLRYKYVLDATKNAQGDFKRTSSGAANQQRLFTEGVKELATNFGQKLYPIGTKVLIFVNDLMKKFNNLTSAQQDTILKVLAMVAAVGPGIFIFGKLTSGIGGAVTMVGKFGGALRTGAKAFDSMKKVGAIGGMFSKFGSIGKAAFMAITSPASIAILAIVAIAIAAFLIIKNWSKIKVFLLNLWKYIKSIFGKVGLDTEKFQQSFAKAKSMIDKNIEAIKQIIKKITPVLKIVINFLKGFFINYLKVLLAAAVGSFSGLLSGILSVINGIMKTIHGLITFLTGVFTGDWKKAWEGVKEIFGGIMDTFVGLAKTPINGVIGLINGAIAGLNKLGLKIPDWVPVLGGKDFSINIPTIPMLAKGTNNWAGGLAMTQERGGEIMDLPKGTRVYPHDKSIQMAKIEGSKNGRSEINVVINKIADNVTIRSDEDIDKLADAFAKKLVKTSGNMGKVEFA